MKGAAWRESALSCRLMRRSSALVLLVLWADGWFFRVSYVASRGGGGYAVSEIDFPASTITAACAINSAGHIVGYYADGAGTHGFLFANGGFSSITASGAAWTATYGVVADDLHQPAPTAPTSRTAVTVSMWSGGRFASSEFPGGTDTVARGMYSRGQVFGYYRAVDGERHGFLLSAGRYSALDVPGGGEGGARAINDGEQIAGVIGSGPVARGVLFSAGTYSRLQFPDSNYTEASGINNIGDVVGQIDTARRRPRAVSGSAKIPTA